MLIPLVLMLLVDFKIARQMIAQTFSYDKSNKLTGKFGFSIHINQLVESDFIFLISIPMIR